MSRTSGFPWMRDSADSRALSLCLLVLTGLTACPLPNNQPDTDFLQRGSDMARASRATEGNHSWAVIVRRRSDGTEGQTAARRSTARVRTHASARRAMSTSSEAPATHIISHITITTLSGTIERNGSSL
jgi:hypothetical protein